MTERKAPQDQPLPDDDVATLYSWANLHGAKYRDFSAARQEARSQARHRADSEPSLAEPPAAPPPPEAKANVPAPERVNPARATSERVTWEELLPPAAHDPRAQSQSAPAVEAPGMKPAKAEASRGEVQTPEKPAGKQQPDAQPHVIAGTQWTQASRIQTPMTQTPPTPVPVTPAPASAARPPEPSSTTHASPSAEPMPQPVPERETSRWYALKGIFDQTGDLPGTSRGREAAIPAIAVFSFAGGVGKTSLIATLSRALAAQGERVLLVDTAAHGPLPFYFGAQDLRPGVVRTFSGSPNDAPIQMISLDPDQDPASRQAALGGHDELIDEVLRNASSAHRILIDLATAAASVTRRVLRLNPTVLVPILPDMSSVVTLQAAASFFRNHKEATGQAVEPCYILNQFDASLPLHLEVQELLRRQLGDRLLPFVLRRSVAVSEALAEGMTVIDYAPSAPIADDYRKLSTWLRSIAPANSGFRGLRWSER